MVLLLLCVRSEWPCDRQPLWLCCRCVVSLRVAAGGWSLLAGRLDRRILMCASLCLSTRLLALHMLARYRSHASRTTFTSLRSASPLSPTASASPSDPIRSPARPTAHIVLQPWRPLRQARRSTTYSKSCSWEIRVRRDEALTDGRSEWTRMQRPLESLARRPCVHPARSLAHCSVLCCVAVASNAVGMEWTAIGVGKSNLLSRFTRDNFSMDEKSTIGVSGRGQSRADGER